MTRNDPDGDLQDQPTPETLRIAASARRAAESLEYVGDSVVHDAITTLLQAAAELEQLHARVGRQSMALAAISPTDRSTAALAKAADDLLTLMDNEPVQLGEIEGGDYAYWCHLCRYGHSGSDINAVTIGATVHVLSPDHEARKILDAAKETGL